MRHQAFLREGLVAGANRAQEVQLLLDSVGAAGALQTQLNQALVLLVLHQRGVGARGHVEQVRGQARGLAPIGIFDNRRVLVDEVAGVHGEVAARVHAHQDLLVDERIQQAEREAVLDSPLQPPQVRALQQVRVDLAVVAFFFKF